MKFEQIICIYWFNLFFIPKHFHNLSACLLDFTLIWVLYALYFIFFNLKLKNWIACFALHLGYFFFKFIFTNFIWIINGKYQYSLSVKTDFQRFRIWEFEVEKILKKNILINNCVVNPTFAGDLIQRPVWSWPQRFQGYRKWGRCRWMGRTWWSST